MSIPGNYRCHVIVEAWLVRSSFFFNYPGTAIVLAIDTRYLSSVDTLDMLDMLAPRHVRPFVSRSC